MAQLSQGAASRDRRVAALASAKAMRVAHDLDRYAIETNEISEAERMHQRDAWIALASDTHRWIDLRVAALEIAVAIDQTMAPAKTLPPAGWKPFLIEDDPEMQLAAVELVPDSKFLAARLLQLIAVELSEELALTAAARHCEAIASTPATLSPIQEARIAELATTSTYSIVARARLVGCLSQSETPASRRALRTLLSESPPSLRRQLQKEGRSPSTVEPASPPARSAPGPSKPALVLP